MSNGPLCQTAVMAAQSGMAHGKDPSEVEGG